MSDEEKQNEDLKLAIERFCKLFPDKFILTERGRMHLPFDEQNKGRLLGAGFHLKVGYYRDDAPLYDMVLTNDQRIERDEMWRDLYFVTDTLVRQFQDFVYFHRTEGYNILTKAEFDFAWQDGTVTSQESMETFANRYVAAVRARKVSEQGVAEIAKYFVDMSRKIRHYEQEQQQAQPVPQKALVQFAAKAWRRPLSEHERTALLDFYRALCESSRMSHEDAIRDVLVSILLSPNFCYRVDFAEHDGRSNRLTNFALANRLSYFLWSSMPDEELIRVAQTGNLQEPDVMVEQALRMLTDHRAQALAIEFGGSWLDFRQFTQHVGVDRTKFEQFTDQLRESMYLEPVYFITDLIQRDGSVKEFLEAKHTYVDENLARHYGIPYAAAEADENGWIRVEHAHAYGRGGILPMSVSALVYPFLGGRSAHHNASHHDTEIEYERISTYYCQQLAYLAQKMQSMPEGDSTVLDNSLLYFVNSMWSGTKHDSTNVPVLTVGGLGGALETGRVLDYSDSGDENRRLCSL